MEHAQVHTKTKMDPPWPKQTKAFPKQTIPTDSFFIGNAVFSEPRPWIKVKMVNPRKEKKERKRSRQKLRTITPDNMLYSFFLLINIIIKISMTFKFINKKSETYFISLVSIKHN